MEKSKYARIIEGRRSEEMTQSNTSTPRGSEVPFESQSRRVMAVKVPQNEEICEGGKDGESKGVGSALSRRRANRGSLNIKKSELG